MRSPKDTARAVAAKGLDAVRRRPPHVLLTPPEMNGGNFLYLWLTAWSATTFRDEPTKALWVPKMEPWLEEFPALRGLTIRREDVRFTNPRGIAWGQQTHTDWLKPEIRRFVAEVLLPGSRFAARLDTVDRTATVVNVRRGDYYSVPKYREQYGFDVPGYVRAAIREVGHIPGDPIVLVSDDPAWCLEHLGFLTEHGPVDVLPGPHDMFQDLAQIAGARRLVLANSTFSYWGAYIASSLPRDERVLRTVAPLFFTRQYNYSESPLLLDEWIALPEDVYPDWPPRTDSAPSRPHESSS